MSGLSNSGQPRNHSPSCWSGVLAEAREMIRGVEADLHDQEIKLYPSTKTGERARSLWRKIKPRLLRGGAVEITTSVLRLKLHREELRRARTILVDMGLIKPTADGRFVLGPLGPHSRIDELIRDQFFDLKLLEGVVVGLSAIMQKSKTQGKRRRS